jgi:DNA repair protein RadC
MKAQSESRAVYNVSPPADTGDAIIREALAILDRRLRVPGAALSSPAAVRDFCRLNLAALEHEVFSVIWLDSQNRLIEYQELFRGTLTQASVYPREVLKACLACNAAAAILTHNHPSSHAEPSGADLTLTQNLKAALALVDCRVIDHMIVGGVGVLSFAERGLI